MVSEIRATRSACQTVKSCLSNHANLNRNEPIVLHVPYPLCANHPYSAVHGTSGEHASSQAAPTQSGCASTTNESFQGQGIKHSLQTCSSMANPRHVTPRACLSSTTAAWHLRSVAAVPCLACLHDMSAYSAVTSVAAARTLAGTPQRSQLPRELSP